MEVLELINKIENINNNNENKYILFELERDIYYGKDSLGNIVFIVESKYPNMLPIIQNTNKLEFKLNIKCNMLIENEEKEKIVNILTCLSEDTEEIKAFIILTQAFANNLKRDDLDALNGLFSALVNLFNNKNVVSDNELEGFFAELYTIYYLNEKGIDIVKYWQRKDRMKFDFYISNQKRLEVKATKRENRIHHFRHEQLISDLYDIVVASYLLRESNEGISLYKLIEKIKELSRNNYDVLLYIENFIKNVSKEKLMSIKYDEIYIKENLKFYNAEKIPKFNQKTPNGVSKAEYDSDMTGSKDISEEELKQWIEVV